MNQVSIFQIIPIIIGLFIIIFNKQIIRLAIIYRSKYSAINKQFKYTEKDYKQSRVIAIIIGFIFIAIGLIQLFFNR